MTSLAAIKIDYTLLGVACGNLIVQIYLIWLTYEQVLKTRRPADIFHHRELMLEMLIQLISVLAFGFFLARLMPIWNARGCFAFHATVMVLYELQLGSFTYVQFCRYIKILQRPWSKRLEGTLLVVFTLTTMLNGYGQDGVINFVGDTGLGTCDFTHDGEIALATAGVHALAEFSFLAYFYRYIDTISKSLQNPHQSPHRRLLRTMVIVQSVFAVWNLFISAVNLFHFNMYIMATVYNLHFTFIVLIVGLPHLARARESANSSGTFGVTRSVATGMSGGGISGAISKGRFSMSQGQPAGRSGVASNWDPSTSRTEGPAPGLDCVAENGPRNQADKPAAHKKTVEKPKGGSKVRENSSITSGF